MGGAPIAACARARTALFVRARFKQRRRNAQRHPTRRRPAGIFATAILPGVCNRPNQSVRRNEVRALARHALQADAALEQIVREGERNDTLWRACMRRAHVARSPDELLVLAQDRNAEFSPPLPDYEVAKIARSAWSYTERGQNYIGGNWTDVIDHLAAPDPNAFALLSILKRSHSRREIFILSTAMHASMGRTVIRWHKARDRLERDGFIQWVHRGGRGPKDPPIYARP